MRMNSHCLHPSYASVLCRTTQVDILWRSPQSGLSWLILMSHLLMRILNRTNLMPPWECTYLCLTNMTTHGESQQCEVSNLETMMDQMPGSKPILLHPIDLILGPQRAEPHPRNGLWTSCFLPGSPMMRVTAQTSPLAKNTLANSSKTMFLILKQPSELS